VKRKLSLGEKGNGKSRGSHSVPHITENPPKSPSIASSSSSNISSPPTQRNRLMMSQSNPEIHPALLSPQPLSQTSAPARKFSLLQKLTRTPPSTPRTHPSSPRSLSPTPDIITILMDRIEASEILLQSLEVQLKSETSKRM
jgi:hypothetical protein